MRRAKKGQSHSSSVHLRDGDSGRVVGVKVGDMLEVDLEENPTTGYSWQVGPLPSVLELKDSRYAPDHPQLCGSGGRRTFRFAVVMPGSGKLGLEYRRAWEKEAAPARVFEITLESA